METNDRRGRPLRSNRKARRGPRRPEGGRRDASRWGLDRLRRPFEFLGPGLVTGASDDDPSGIGTYAQVGAQFGYALLWTAALTYPLMVSVQELCGRIALRTRVGLAVSLRRRFPAWIVGGSVLALFVANTINLGADLGAVAEGGRLLSGNRISALVLLIPITLGIFAFQAWSTYPTIARTFRWLAMVLLAYLVTAVLVHPDLATVLAATFIPRFEASGAFLLAIVAVLGTTISPYLFFWQASAEAEKGTKSGAETGRAGGSAGPLRTMRADVAVGMALSQAVMWAIILTAAAELHPHAAGATLTAPQAAAALGPLAGPYAFLLFSVGLIGSGLLAVPVLSGSATYAIKEFAGLRGSLDATPRQRPWFYAILGGATAIGFAINLLGIDPIQALVDSAVINGLLAPPLLLLIIVLGSDERVMGRAASGGVSRVLTWAAFLLMTRTGVALVVSLLAGLP